MKTFDKIVGYVYKADIFCEKCIRRKLRVENFITEKERSHKTEDFLDLISEEMGIKRDDEYSFDSWEFPKVIFASDIELEIDYCSACKKLIS